MPRLGMGQGLGAYVCQYKSIMDRKLPSASLRMRLFLAAAWEICVPPRLLHTQRPVNGAAVALWDVLAFHSGLLGPRIPY